MGIDDDIKEVEKKSFLPSWVRKDKINKIKELEIFPLVHEWLLNCVPEVEVARRIQNHGIMTDEAVSTISSYVSHYRATIPPTHILVRQIPKDIAKTYRRLTPMKNYIEKLDDMLEGQLSQVNKAKAQADEIPYSFPAYGEEVERFLKILKDVQRLRKDAGLTDKDLEQFEKADPFGFDLDKIYSRPGITDQLKDPKSRTKILGTVERLLEMVINKQKKGEDFNFEKSVEQPDDSLERVDSVEVKEDGQVVPVNPVASDFNPVPDAAPLEVIEQIDLSTLTAEDFKPQGET